MTSERPITMTGNKCARKIDLKSSTVYSKQGALQQSALQQSELEALQCSFCRGILRNPMQVITCGHRFCHDCIHAVMSHGDGPYRCPEDDEMFMKHEVRKDRGCLKELQGLEIDCTTQPKPCQWKGPLTELETHLAKCPNVRVSCSLGCGASLSKDQLSAHTASQCPNRPSQCQHCKKKVPTSLLEEHYQACEEAPAECNYCQQKLSSRKLMARHLETKCNEYQMTCPMHTQSDCHFQDKRPQISQHMQGHLIEMAELLTRALGRIEKLESVVEKMTAANHRSERKIGELTSKLEEVEQKCEEKGQHIVLLEKKIQSIELVNRIQSTRDVVESDCAVTRYKGQSVASDVLSSAYSSTRNMTSSYPVKSLCGSAFPSQSTEAEASRMKQEIDTHQTQLLKMSENLQSVQQSLTQHAVVIDEVRLRQDVLDVKTTNGVFVWKIPDIRRRFRDAMEGRTISLYSPPFYTSPHGYRMCVRTYLNGDGIGKGTHMSMFFVLMRSEHDSLLTYPFKQSVRFTLVNQANPASSITEAFVPDLSSPSFQRPEKDMNVASGFPKFARQSILHDEHFTQGNAIYIKCQVDLTGLTPQ